MDLGGRSDDDLLALAVGGRSAAFGVLLRRHAVLLAAAVADASDPDRALRRIGLAAMRGLHERPAPTDPLGWLARAIASESGDRIARPSTGPRDDTAVADDRARERFDRVWVELEHRWPRGRSPLRVPVPLRWVAAAATVAAVAAGGTTLLLETGGQPPVVDRLLAYPIEGTIDEDAFSPPASLDPEDLVDLPVFTLPTVPSTDGGSAPDPATGSAGAP